MNAEHDYDGDLLRCVCAIDNVPPQRGLDDSGTDDSSSFQRGASLLREIADIAASLAVPALLLLTISHPLVGLTGLGLVGGGVFTVNMIGRT